MLTFFRQFRMLSGQDKVTFCFLTGVVGLILAAIGGYIANIVKFAGMVSENAEVGAMLIGRVIGMFFLPLGAVLGFF